MGHSRSTPRLVSLPFRSDLLPRVHPGAILPSHSPGTTQHLGCSSSGLAIALPATLRPSETTFLSSHPYLKVNGKKRDTLQPSRQSHRPILTPSFSLWQVEMAVRSSEAPSRPFAIFSKCHPGDSLFSGDDKRAWHGSSIDNSRTCARSKLHGTRSHR